MSIPSIQSVLQEMQSLSTAAAKGGRIDVAVGAPDKGGFASELQASLSRINDMQAKARAQANAFQAGDPSVSLHDVMIDNQKASLAFQMGVQVRNRLISAYKDIMNMQV